MVVREAPDGAVPDRSSGCYDAARRRLTHEGPNKRIVSFPADGVSFSSRFDGGSLGTVTRISRDEFRVTIPEDATASGMTTGYTTWFYFEVLVDAPQEDGRAESQCTEKECEKRVTATDGARHLQLTLANMNNQRGLYANGYTVLHCAMDASDCATDAQPELVDQYFENERLWKRLPTPIDVQKYTQDPHISSAGNTTSDSDKNQSILKSMPTKSETKMTIEFKHHLQFPRERVRFAFCYPFTYTKLQRQLAFLSAASTCAASLYFHRDVIAHSLGGLPIEVVTISSIDHMLTVLDTNESTLEGLYPIQGRDRARSFDRTRKKTVLITARVHPGETPANFMLDGMLRLLLDPCDDHAAQLRRRFVFKILPVLNPDGVCQGFYRTDLRGVNLNRVYQDPHLDSEPAAYATKALLRNIVEQYGPEAARDNVVYLDLHAHANHRGCFVYGNRLVQDDATDSRPIDWTRQVKTQLYAKLASLHSPFFDYGACSFAADDMTRHDARDNHNATTSRAGSSRVGLFHATDLTYVYTLECNYNEGRRRLETSTTTQRTHPKPEALSNTDHPNIQRPAAARGSGSRLFIKYSPAEWMDVGRGCLVALLDLFEVTSAWGKNVSAEVMDSPYRTLDGVKKSILSDLNAAEFGKAASTIKQLPLEVSGSLNRLSISKPSDSRSQRRANTPTSPSTLSKY